MPPRVQYATTEDGVSIAYSVAGSGSPLVYLQPYSHTLREWELPETRDWYTLLAGHHQLIRLDVRHFGLSQRDAGPITLDTCLADVEAVVRRLGLAQFDLLGASGLSAVAIAYASAQPGRVKRVVLWSPANILAPSGTRQASRLRAMYALTEVDPDTMLELQARWIFGEQPRTDQQAFVRDAMRPEDLAEYLDYFRDLDVWACLPLIRAPTLVVYARRSEYMPIDHAQRIAAAIPNSEFLDADTDMYPFLGPDLAHNLQILAGFLGPAAAAQPPAVKQPNRSAGLDLSGRELQVLALIAAGRSNQEVADELGVSVSTVDRHVANIYAKVNVHNRAEATLWAVAHSIVTPPAT